MTHHSALFVCHSPSFCFKHLSQKSISFYCPSFSFSFSLISNRTVTGFTLSGSNAPLSTSPRFVHNPAHPLRPEG